VLILTFARTSHITCATKTALVNVGERYIFETEHALAIGKAPEKVVHECSDLTPYLKDQRPPSDWKGKRLLLYRRGPIGDQVMSSVVPRYFSQILGAKVFMAVERSLYELWLSNPFIEQLPNMMPIHLDCIWRAKGKPFFDYSYFIESSYEQDSSPEQPTAIDRIYSSVDIDPEQVPSELKVPNFDLTPEEIQSRDRSLQILGNQYGRDLTRGYLVLQPLSADVTRSFPVPLIDKALEAANAIVDKHGLGGILVVHSELFTPEVARMIESCPSGIDLGGKIPSVRTFAALIQGARAVVAPDSASIHFAAAFKVPCVLVFATHSPESRISTYPHHIALHKELCPPCFNVLLNKLPTQRCPRGEQQQHCENFLVTGTEITDALEELLQK
jgi:hypothetical protein